MVKHSQLTVQLFVKFNAWLWQRNTTHNDVSMHNHWSSMCLRNWLMLQEACGIQYLIPEKCTELCVVR